MLAVAVIAAISDDDMVKKIDAHCLTSLADALGDLVITGPTHTNVNDFRVLLVL